MEFRSLGATGLKVSVFSFGTMSFVGNNRQSVIGTTDVPEARRLVDRCLDAGVNLFDTACIRMASPNGSWAKHSRTDNLGATTWSLSDEELQRLDDLTVPRILYPYWHQQFSAAGRLGPADVWPRPRLDAARL